jgi:hypothetical protein
MDEPPVRLLLGSEAFAYATAAARAQLASDESWHELSRSADRDDATPAERDPLGIHTQRESDRMTATYAAIAAAQPDLLRLGDDAVNFYLVEQHGCYTLFDAGLPASFDQLVAVLADRGADVTGHRRRHADPRPRRPHRRRRARPRRGPSARPRLLRHRALSGWSCSSRSGGGP